VYSTYNLSNSIRGVIFPSRTTSCLTIRSHNTQLYHRVFLWIYPSYGADSNWLQQGFITYCLNKQQLYRADSYGSSNRAHALACTHVRSSNSLAYINRLQNEITVLFQYYKGREAVGMWASGCLAGTSPTIVSLGHEDYCLLGHNATYHVIQLSMFRKNMLRPSSGYNENGVNRYLRKVDSYLLDCALSNPWKLS
jgi:hypothetical protein